MNEWTEAVLVLHAAPLPVKQRETKTCINAHEIQHDGCRRVPRLRQLTRPPHNYHHEKRNA